MCGSNAPKSYGSSGSVCFVGVPAAPFCCWTCAIAGVPSKFGSQTPHCAAQFPPYLAPRNVPSSPTPEALVAEFLLRWLHYLGGITWIGLLYYFNFVQGPFMAEADPAAKSTATQKLLPRALRWFRCGAIVTFLTGILIIGKRFGESPLGAAAWSTPWAITILTGALFGTLMFFNV